VLLNDRKSRNPRFWNRGNRDSFRINNLQTVIFHKPFVINTLAIWGNKEIMKADRGNSGPGTEDFQVRLESTTYEAFKV
jgi:hypothetical protein